MVRIDRSARLDFFLCRKLTLVIFDKCLKQSLLFREQLQKLKLGKIMTILEAVDSSARLATH